MNCLAWRECQGLSERFFFHSFSLLLIYPSLYLSSLPLILSSRLEFPFLWPALLSFTLSVAERGVTPVSAPSALNLRFRIRVALFFRGGRVLWSVELSVTPCLSSSFLLLLLLPLPPFPSAFFVLRSLFISFFLFFALFSSQFSTVNSVLFILHCALFSFTTSTSLPLGLGGRIRPLSFVDVAPDGRRSWWAWTKIDFRSKFYLWIVVSRLFKALSTMLFLGAGVWLDINRRSRDDLGYSYVRSLCLYQICCLLGYIPAYLFSPGSEGVSVNIFMNWSCLWLRRLFVSLALEGPVALIRSVWCMIVYYHPLTCFQSLLFSFFCFHVFLSLRIWSKMRFCFVFNSSSGCIIGYFVHKTWVAFLWLEQLAYGL